MATKVRVGLFGIGLDTYWPQFDGLLDRLMGYQEQIKHRIDGFGVEVADAGMVDNPAKARKAADYLKSQDVEMIFLFVSTYALSSTVLPVAQKLKVPVILWGGITTNFIWTTFLSVKNKTYNDFTNKSTPIAKNLMFSALAGSIWYLQFFFYGMGESKLGNGASSWILHMSIIILTANMWGIYRQEWKGVAIKTKWTITVGIAVILLSVVLVGVGNSM